MRAQRSSAGNASRSLMTTSCLRCNMPPSLFPSGTTKAHRATFATQCPPASLTRISLLRQTTLNCKWRFWLEMLMILMAFRMLTKCTLNCPHRTFPKRFYLRQEEAPALLLQQLCSAALPQSAHVMDTSSTISCRLPFLHPRLSPSPLNPIQTTQIRLMCLRKKDSARNAYSLGQMHLTPPANPLTLHHLL